MWEVLIRKVEAASHRSTEPRVGAWAKVFLPFVRTTLTVCLSVLILASWIFKGLESVRQAGFVPFAPEANALSRLSYGRTRRIAERNPISLKPVYRTGLALALFISLLAADSGPRIELAGGSFRVSGIADMAEPREGWQAVFTVSTGAADGPPMLGAYSAEGGAIVFTPRFPLASGVRYHAVYRPRGRAGASAEAWFDGPPARLAAEARVERIYPS